MKLIHNLVILLISFRAALSVSICKRVCTEFCQEDYLVEKGICICEQGYYSIDPSSQYSPCLKCPVGSTTAMRGVNAMLISECICYDTHALPITNDRITCQCQEGYYGTAQTVDSCVKCPDHTTSQIGSTQLSQCKCADNNTVAVSDLTSPCQCKENYYGTGLTQGSCKQCPFGSTSNAGSTQINQCSCTDKKTVPLSSYIDTCRCQAGYYGTGKTSDSCQKCPQGSTSDEGSTDISHCKCLDNHTIALSKDFTSCQCQGGFYGDDQTADSCKKCPYGSNSNLGSKQISDCKCFDQNTVALSKEVTTCQCQPNFYGSGQSLNSCKQCPTGSTSDQNSTKISDCNCVDQHTIIFSDEVSTCQCQPNYYGTGKSLNSCKYCPSGSKSKSSSTEISKCKCSDKNSLNLSSQITTCVCKPNYYGTAQTEGSCKLCPDNMISDQGSTQISQCKCADSNAVYVPNPLNTCQCKPNFYGTGLTSNSCQKCPTGSFSEAGSTLKTQCKCADSKFAELSDRITSWMCKSGFFGKEFTANSCQECPIGSTSNLGAQNISDCNCSDQNTDPLSDTNIDCICKQGYYGSGKEPNSCKQCPKGLTTYSSGSNNIMQCVSLFCKTIPEDEESQKSWCNQCFSVSSFKIDSRVKLCNQYFTKGLLLQSITYLIIILVQSLI